MASTEPLGSRSGVERLADRLEKPSVDDRTYRVIKLPNDLEALLIHDPDTDKAAAAMDVNVGAFSDAEDMPGMAHAVEHLLFMGTEKVRLRLARVDWHSDGRWRIDDGRWQAWRLTPRLRSIQARTTTTNI